MPSSLSKMQARLRRGHSPGLLRIADRLQKLATPSSKDYLQSLNFSALKKRTTRPPETKASDFYRTMQENAENGPLFSSKVLTTIENMANVLTKPEASGLGTWLEKVVRSDPDADLKEASLIAAWAVATNKSLVNEGYQQVLDTARSWMQDPQKAKSKADETGVFNTKNVIFKCSNGYTVVNISDEHDLYLEGEIMQNCLAEDSHGPTYWQSTEDGDIFIYSLRDKSNNPHVSMEFANRREPYAKQILGKQNDTPDDKYAPYIGEFLAGFRHEWNEVSIGYATPDTLTKLSTSHNYELRKEVAANSKTPQATLMAMTEDPEEEVRAILAKTWSYVSPAHGFSRSQSASAEILNKLASDKHPNVRLEVARNRNTPPSSLDSLCKDPDDDVRTSAARNPYTNVETLRKMIDDEIVTVRAAVAINGRMAPEDLDRLSKDENYYVRLNIAKNTSTGSDTLNRIIQDREQNPEVRKFIAKNPNTSPETLDRISADPADPVRMEVAKNVNTSTHTLDIMVQSKEDNLEVLNYIISNRNVSDKALDFLSKDANKELREMAKERKLEHKKASLSQRLTLLADSLL